MLGHRRNWTPWRTHDLKNIDFSPHIWKHFINEAFSLLLPGLTEAKLHQLMLALKRYPLSKPKAIYVLGKPGPARFAAISAIGGSSLTARRHFHMNFSSAFERQPLTYRNMHLRPGSNPFCKLRTHICHQSLRLRFSDTGDDRANCSSKTLLEHKGQLEGSLRLKKWEIENTKSHNSVSLVSRKRPAPHDSQRVALAINQSETN